MAISAYVYFTLDLDGKLELALTKVLDVAVLVDEESSHRELVVVYIEEVYSMKAGLVRLRDIRRMSWARRKAMIARSNPEFRDLLKPHGLLLPPASGPPPDQSGVASRVSGGPKGPRSGAIALTLPVDTTA